MRFVLGMAVRETRASWQRLVFFFVCIAVGVAAIVALRSVIRSVRDVLAAVPRQAALVGRAEIVVAIADAARRRHVETAENVQQRGLSAARRADNRHEFPAGDVERQRMQNRERLAAADDGFRDVPKRDHERVVDPAAMTGFSTDQTLPATMSAPSAVG